MRARAMRTTWQRPDGIMRVTRDVDMDLTEARARSRRVPVAMMVIFIMFLTMGFDLEADWFAGQSGSARYRYSQRLLYDGGSAVDRFNEDLDRLEEAHLNWNNATNATGAAAAGTFVPVLQGPGGEGEGALARRVRSADDVNEEEDASFLVTDIAKSYRGRWCMEERDKDVETYPDVFTSECGTLAMKLTTGTERRTNSTTSFATIVLQNQKRTTELTVKMHGEFKTHRTHLLLLGSMRDMFRKNQPEKGSKYKRPYYTPCKITSFIKVRNALDAATNALGESRVQSDTSNGANATAAATARPGPSVDFYDSFEDGIAMDNDNFNLLSLDGRMESENCGWRVHMNATSMNMDRTISKVTNYCFMMVSIAILQLVCLVHQVQQVANPGVSLLSLGQQAMIDAYLCLLHLTAGIVADSMFSALATAAFCEFVVFSMFEMRYLIACSHSRLGNQNSWFEAQADIGTIYGRFYGLLLSGIILVYEFKDSYWFLTFVFYSFWIPQIVRNAIHAYRRPLKPLFIIGMSLCRLMLPMYFFGCPKNFLKVPYSPKMCFSLTFYVGAQAGLLLLQYYKGSRCFIPKIFLPEQYNYYRKLNTSQSSELHTKVQEEGGLDCVICMAPIDFTNPSKRMVTPCNHFFHPECLERWLKVKMECPTCRRQLPPAEY